MSKTLVLTTQGKNQYFPEFCESCDMLPIYKSNGKLHRVIRKILLKMQLPGIKIFFSHWVKYADNDDLIVVFDTGNIAEIVEWLRKRYLDKRIIVWYWNSAKNTVNPNQITSKNIEIWSFDDEDCKSYGLKFNTQFYFKENLNRCDNKSIDNCDVFYVGSDKDRAKTLFDLKDIFDKYGITYHYNLTQYGKNTNSYGLQYQKVLSYPEVINWIKHSRVILDLVAENQSGLTLRPLEALYFKKKLITNMKNIVDYDFYRRENIFILGVDDIAGLPDFIKNNFNDNGLEIYRKQYSFEEWLKRFTK